MSSRRLPKDPTNLSVEGLDPILFKGEDKHCKFLSCYTNPDRLRYFNRYLDQANREGNVEILFDEDSKDEQTVMALMRDKGDEILEEINYYLGSHNSNYSSGLDPQFIEYLNENTLKKIEPVGAIVSNNGGVILLHEGLTR
jgi:hypothetical protein